MDKTNFRRVVHTVFEASIPPHCAETALQLANQFIEWMTSQTDVYLRFEPQIHIDENGKTLLRFRAGLDRNPKMIFPGRIFTSITAWEELMEIDAKPKRLSSRNEEWESL